MRTPIAFTFMMLLGFSAHAYEGTPQPEVMDGKRFEGKAKDAAGNAVDCSLKFQNGKLASAWFEKIGFAAPEYKLGCLEGDSKTESLHITGVSTSDKHGSLHLSVVIADWKTLKAEVVITDKLGSKTAYTIEAELEASK